MTRHPFQDCHGIFRHLTEHFGGYMGDVLLINSLHTHAGMPFDGGYTFVTHDMTKIAKLCGPMQDD